MAKQILFINPTYLFPCPCYIVDDELVTWPHSKIKIKIKIKDIINMFKKINHKFKI